MTTEGFTAAGEAGERAQEVDGAAGGSIRVQPPHRFAQEGNEDGRDHDWNQR